MPRSRSVPCCPLHRRTAPSAELETDQLVPLHRLCHVSPAWFEIDMRRKKKSCRRPTAKKRKERHLPVSEMGNTPVQTTAAPAPIVRDVKNTPVTDEEFQLWTHQIAEHMYICQQQLLPREMKNQARAL